MTKARELSEQLREDDIEELDQEGIDLPPGVQARWRKHEEPHKLPREREKEREQARGEFRYKPHRMRRDSR